MTVSYADNPIADFDSGEFAWATADYTLGTILIPTVQTGLDAVDTAWERNADTPCCQWGKTTLCLCERVALDVDKADGDFVCSGAIVIPNEETLVADDWRRRVGQIIT
jgi:hypothetical protein